MASKDELISKAVTSSIEEDEVIDLLLISDYLDDINDEDIGKVRDYGMHYSYLYIGMSGQKMVDKMNENWEATDAEFLAHNRAINLRIVSEDIKQIRENNGVIEYSKDGENWISLISKWGGITGDITQQSDLQAALLSKANQLDFDMLSETVQLHGNTITLIQSDINTLTTQITQIINQISGVNGILVRLDGIDTALRSKIGSENVLQIRETNGSLEYTTDGSTWTPVSTAGIVQWGDITGNINNQPDLIRKLNDITDIAQAASDKVDTLEDTIDTKIDAAVDPVEADLAAHTQNTNNPHQVTRDQIGIHILNKDDFDALVTKQSNDLYIVDDTFYNAYKYTLTFNFNGGTWNSNTIYDYYHGDDTSILFSDVITSTPTYTGHTFLGFSASATATVATYTLSDNYNIPNDNIILYAVWS